MAFSLLFLEVTALILLDKVSPVIPPNNACFFIHRKRLTFNIQSYDILRLSVSNNIIRLKDITPEEQCYDEKN